AAGTPPPRRATRTPRRGRRRSRPRRSSPRCETLRGALAAHRGADPLRGRAQAREDLRAEALLVANDREQEIFRQDRSIRGGLVDELNDLLRFGAEGDLAREAFPPARRNDR